MKDNIFIILLAYLLGSIPSGLLISRMSRGIDPRYQGSGNIGATNVLRTAGKLQGVLTLLADVGKGALAVMLAGRLSPVGGTWIYVAGFIAVLGHLYPLFLKFRGGKGVATGFGVLAVLHPWAAFLTISVWLISFLIFRISSVGALWAYGALPLISFLIEGSGAFFLFSCLLSLLVISRHMDNIQRLARGAEGKIDLSRP